jgi:hypothetical protein
MRRAYRLAFSLVVLLSLGSCASTGGIPKNPFGDITVPETFLPYSDQWLFIKSPRVTAAKLVYMTQLDTEGAVAAVRAALAKDGWAPQAVNRGVSRDGFTMVTVDFTKGRDSCRATVIEGANATHVDLAVARLTTK